SELELYSTLADLERSDVVGPHLSPTIIGAHYDRALIEPSATYYLALGVISNQSALGIRALALIRPKKFSALALRLSMSASAKEGITLTPRLNPKKFSALALMSASVARSRFTLIECGTHESEPSVGLGSRQA